MKRLSMSLLFMFLLFCSSLFVFQATDSQVHATIHIEASASQGPWVFHGLALDSTLSADFPAAQPKKVIGKARYNFSYTTTVQFSLGEHRIEYGAAQYNGSLPYPWEAKLFLNGEKIKEGIVRERQHLIGEVTLRKPVSPLVDLFIREDSDLLLFAMAVSLFTIFYAGYLLFTVKEDEDFQ